MGKIAHATHGFDIRATSEEVAAATRYEEWIERESEQLWSELPKKQKGRRTSDTPPP